MKILQPVRAFSSQMSSYFPSNETLKTDSWACKTYTFQITEDCNLRCSYCYQINKSKKVMSFETAKKAVDCLFEDNDKLKGYFSHDKISALILEFVGGEPFLEIELIDKIVDYYVKQAVKFKSPLAYRFMISMSTNGTLYSDPKVQAFIKKWRSKLSLGISLDGCKELHDACRVFPDGSGSYDLATSAAKQELKYNANLSTKMTFAPSNIDYIPEAIKNLIDIGYKNIYCNCVFEDIWKPGDEKRFYFKLKETADWLLTLDTIPYISVFSKICGHPMSARDNRNWCGGTGLMLCVNPDGNFYPCLRYTESSVGTAVEPYIIGNVEHGIAKSSTEIEKIKCLSCITRESQSTEECFNCSIASGCAWCSGYNYQLYGTPDKRATFICPMHKARVLANCYFWNKFYRLTNQEERFKLYLEDEKCLDIINEDELSLLKQLESE